MKNSIALIFLLLYFLSNKAQSYENLLKQNKFKKLEEELQKKIAHNSNDVQALYFYSVLFQTDNNPNKDLYTAYLKILDAETSYAFVSIDVKIKEHLLKEGITDQILIANRLSICQKALNEILPLENLAKYEEYLSHYLKGEKILALAILERDSLALNIAIKINTEISYQKFIDNYRESSLKRSAIHKRDSIAFTNVKSENTAEGYERFLNKYPSSEYQSEVKQKRDKAAFEFAEKENTEQSFAAFIEKYPRALQVQEAGLRLQDKAYENALTDSTIESLEKFIGKYPQGHHLQDAKNRRNEIAFNMALKAGTVEALNNYISSYPDAKQVEEITGRILLIAKENYDIPLIESMLRNETNEEKKLVLWNWLYETYTFDGEESTIEYFEEQYPDHPLQERIEKDKIIASEAYSPSSWLSKTIDVKFFDEIIKRSAPKEIAFVALQRIISNSIKQGRYADALKLVQQYAVYFPQHDIRIDDLLSLLVNSKDPSIKPIKLPPSINSANISELTPIPSVVRKELFFCRHYANTNEEIFHSFFTKSGWSNAEPISELNTSHADAPLAISADGVTMILFRDGKLYSTNRERFNWSEPEELGYPFNEAGWNGDLCYSSDRKVILFTSDIDCKWNHYRKKDEKFYHGVFGSLGPDTRLQNLNIFASVWDGNKWSDPIDLGPKINTSFTERGPFLHPDMKTLYFASDGHGGLGEMDIFRSTRLADSCWNCWSTPVNLGKEINTAESEEFFQVSLEGDVAFYSSDKDGTDDIYNINLPPHMRPGFVATISGQLLDKSNKPIDATIKWEDLSTAKSVGESKTNPADGNYFIVLPLGKIYGYYVDKQDYFPVSNSLDLRKENKPIKIEENINTVSLQEMAQDSVAVPINNLFFNFNEDKLLPFSIPELKRVAQIIKAQKLKVEIAGHTDDVGTIEYNIDLSKRRATSVMEFLVSQGCDAKLLTVIGYGKSRPILPNDTERNRAKNRRAELRFLVN
jgi:outer membrane protein OmpA-like peptidoglycan-associated protein/outer membrane protein assembly factor BamD (BamD/ComL family)